MTDAAIPTRDPAIIYAEKESRTCKGCVHIHAIRALGSVHQVCSKNPKRTLERKCREYRPDERAV